MHSQLLPIPISEVCMGKATQMQRGSLLVSNVVSFEQVLPKQYQAFFFFFLFEEKGLKEEENNGNCSNSEGIFPPNLQKHQADF